MAYVPHRSSIQARQSRLLMFANTAFSDGKTYVLEDSLELAFQDFTLLPDETQVFVINATVAAMPFMADYSRVDILAGLVPEEILWLYAVEAAIWRLVHVGIGVESIFSLTEFVPPSSMRRVRPIQHDGDEMEMPEPRVLFPSPEA